VVAQVGHLEADPAGYGFTQALAASLLEMLPSNRADVLTVLDQTCFLLGYWKERMAAIDTTGQLPGAVDLSLDDWLLDRLESSPGFRPDRSAWTQRRERLTQKLEERRREDQRSADKARDKIGLTESQMITSPKAPPTTTDGVTAPWVNATLDELAGIGYLRSIRPDEPLARGMSSDQAKCLVREWSMNSWAVVRDLP
jgi:hypothetical protein